MNGFDTQAEDEDTTMAMLRTLRDGSVAGLAVYELMKMDLVSIRSLPERREPPFTNL